MTGARPAWARYGAAMIAVAVALLLKLVVTPPDLVESPFLLFFAAVTVSAWYGGLGPGLVATGLAALGSAVVFLPPTFTFAVGTPADQMRLGLFLLEGGVISGLSGALHRARRQALAALRARDELLQVASHELKNPLAALLGNIQLLERRAANLGDRERRTIAAVGSQAARLNRLVDSLLDLSRIREGRLTISPAPLDLVALTRRLVEELQPTLEQHTLRFHAPDSHVEVLGDALSLEQVIQNLLQNAVKYSPDGGVITVRVALTVTHATVSVDDTGVGIAATALPHIFERYYRAPDAPSGTTGLGIGLAIVQEIAALHHGSVSVQSTEGVGSTFTLTLPRSSPTRRALRARQLAG